MSLKTILVALALASGTRCFPMQINDDFSEATNTWILGSGWSFQNPTPGMYQLRGDNISDTLSWKTNWLLDASWSFEADLQFQSLFADGATTGTASLALAANNSNPGVRLLADVQHHVSGAALISVHWFDGSWHEVFNSGWLNGTVPVYHLKLQRLSNTTNLQFTVTATNGFAFSGSSTTMSASFLNGLSTPGLRVSGARADFSTFSITTPAAVPSMSASHYRLVASNVVNDLLNHFWSGNSTAGQIVNTWYGYTTNLPQARGALWERATLYFVLDNYSRLTGDIAIQQRLKADWNRTKSSYTPQELEACGEDSGTNWASDDAGWSAMIYLAAYRSTGDSNALNRAKGLVNAAFVRWVDDQLEGGMWYSDARQVKSLYQTALLLSSLKLYEATGDKSYLEKTIKCYTWIERHLLRNDGLYWADYGSAGPVGAERPDDIHEAGSVSFLGGNMAMAVLHARLYRLTNEDEYRKRALRSTDAIFSRLVDTNLVYINDRDAWTDGTFAGDWAREVLTLPGVSTKHWNTLRSTADAIYTKARTTDGYYGGSWDGPADGPGSTWFQIGSKAQQIMTSASSANLIVAAAFLESPTSSNAPPQLFITPQAGAVKLSVIGEKGLRYRLDGSSNFSAWSSVINFMSLGVPVTTTIPFTNATGFYRAALLEE